MPHRISPLLALLFTLVAGAAPLCAAPKPVYSLVLENIAKLEETPTAAKMKIIRGKNAVLVYMGVIKEEISSTAYLATFKNKDGSAAQVPPTILYQTKDGWAIWQ